MTVRTRLILAFGAFSVVPLAAVTLYSYFSSVDAFERAVRRESAAAAEEIGQRMELVTEDLGRRVDRFFAAATTDSGGSSESIPGDLQAKLAPLLGEAAVLLERIEFRPEPTPEQPSTPAPDAPEAPVVRHGAPPPPPSPPKPPRPIVVDVPGIIAEARRAGQIPTDEAMERVVAEGLERGLAGVELGLKVAAEALAQRAAAAGARAKSETPATSTDGRRLRVPVRRSGEVVGTAEATLNMQRTLPAVLALARREQGEVPFAIDRQGALHTARLEDEAVLRGMGVAAIAPRAAAGEPQRTGDWIVVARQEQGDLLFGIARPIGASLREIRRASLRNLSLGLLVIGLAIAGIVPLSHRMTRHLSVLTDGVRQIAGGDFRARVPVRSGDEFGALASAFNQMAQDLERHQAMLVEQERLRRELELSRRIQTEMLPHDALRIGPAEIRGVSIPAREVGGDFFNYFALPDGRLALLVGDVSGKGVSAALLMANVQATLRARVPLQTDLAELTDALDREFEAQTPGGVYLTLFLAIFEPETGTLRYVNAGHHPQFLLRTDGTIDALPSSGLPIALYAGNGYRECRTVLDVGDLLFFYTDGLVETENAAGEMFEVDRLRAILEADRGANIDTVLTRVEDAIKTFRGTAEPFDDATMMALKLNA